MTSNLVVKTREIRTLEDIYDQLPPRLKCWIDQENPSPAQTLDRGAGLAYLLEKRLPATPYAVKAAFESGELPSRFVGRTRRASERDLLIWGVTR